VRFEWVRIRTVRSTYWLIGSALLLDLTVALAVAVLTRNDPHSHEVIGIVLTGGGPDSPVPFAAVFLAAVGVLATGHEYRYGTIQPTLTTVPRRSTLLTAKLAVLAGTALVVTIVSFLVTTSVLLLVWGGVPGLTDSPLNGAIAGHLAQVLLWTVLGAALGQLFRGVPAALVVLLVVPLIVEQLLITLSYVPVLHWLTAVVPFLPFTAGQQLLGLGGEQDFAFFDRWASGGVFAAFVAIVLAAAWTLFTRRDA
jgi:ABC-type transport system involved in multi-copper enzyme maturation permease subunit